MLARQVDNPAEHGRWFNFALTLFQDIGDEDGIKALSALNRGETSHSRTRSPFVTDRARLAEYYDTLSRVLALSGDEAGARQAHEQAEALRKALR